MSPTIETDIRKGVVLMIGGNYRLRSIEEKALAAYEALLEAAKGGKMLGAKSLFESMRFKIPGCPLCHFPCRQNEAILIAEVFDTLSLVHLDCLDKENEAYENENEAEDAGERGELNDLAQEVIDS